MFSKLMFIPILMIGTFITVSSSSWLSAWIGLEINLLGFIPLISSTTNSRNNEAMLKYFLTQAFASSFFLLGILIISFSLSHNFIMFMSNYIMITALMLKLGAAPLHFWFPSVLEGMTWMNCFILMTWQKLAPLIVLLSTPSAFFFIFIVLSGIIGALGGINQTLLKKLLAYSSINHLGWLITSAFLNKSLLMMYFIIYTFLTILMTSMFTQFNSSHLNQIPGFSISPNIASILSLSLLSLGGLPPFLGFLPKWLMIQASVSLLPLIIMILIMSSLTTLYYYLRITYSVFLKSFSVSSTSNIYTSKMLHILSTISTFSLFFLLPMFI